MGISKIEKDKIKNAFKEAEDRVVAKVIKRAQELSKDKKLMDKIESEVRKEYAKQTLHKRDLQGKKTS